MKTNNSINPYWLVLTVLAFISSAFLITDYNVTKNSTDVALKKHQLLQKEVSVDEEDYQTRDFNIYNDIKETIQNLLSLGY